MGARRVDHTPEASEGDEEDGEGVGTECRSWS